MKKILNFCLLFILLFFVGTFTPARAKTIDEYTAYVSGLNKKELVNSLFIKYKDASELEYQRRNYASDKEKIEAYYKIIKNTVCGITDSFFFELKFNVDKMQIEKEKKNTIIAYKLFVRDHPEIFWITEGLMLEHSGDMITIKPKIWDHWSENEALLEKDTRKVLSHILKFIEEAKEKKRIYLRVKYVHDELVLRNKYKEEPGTLSAMSHTMLGAILDEYSPVCESYAKALMVLLNKLDICTTLGIGLSYVSGTIGVGAGEPHAWNYVFLKNEWFFIDTTWDDPLPDRPGVVGYKYFLKKKPKDRNNNLPGEIHVQSILPPVGENDYVDEGNDEIVENPASDIVIILDENGNVLNKTLYTEAVNYVLALPNPRKDGKIFIGWQVLESGKFITMGVSVLGDTHIVPVFEVPQFDISNARNKTNFHYVINNKTNGEILIKVVNKGLKITKCDIPDKLNKRVVGKHKIDIEVASIYSEEKFSCSVTVEVEGRKKPEHNKTILGIVLGITLGSVVLISLFSIPFGKRKNK